MARPKRKDNIIEIAKECGVSASTVSRVLNNRSEVSESIRRKVQEALEKRSFVAAPMKRRRFNIGVIVPIVNRGKPMDIYESLALSGISTALMEKDMESTLIFHKEKGSVKLPDALRSRGCHSAILLGSDKLKEDEQELLSCGIPIFILNARWGDSKLTYIDSDSFGAGLLLGRYLAASGHSNISILQNLPVSNHLERQRGIEQALVEKFGENNFKLFVSPYICSARIAESGLLQTEYLLRENRETTAIIGINDQMAYGAIRACAKHGVKIPDDIAIAGFDDYPLSATYNPPLTTVKQPIFEMGYLAGSYAAASLSTMEKTDIRSVIMPGELIIRESTSK